MIKPVGRIGRIYDLEFNSCSEAEQVYEILKDICYTDKYILACQVEKICSVFGLFNTNGLGIAGWDRVVDFYKNGNMITFVSPRDMSYIFCQNLTYKGVNM